MVHQFSSSLTNYSDSWPEPVNQEEHNSNVKMPNLDTTRRESIISQLLTLSLAERERRVRVCKRREKKKTSIGRSNSIEWSAARYSMWHVRRAPCRLHQIWMERFTEPGNIPFHPMQWRLFIMAIAKIIILIPVSSCSSQTRGAKTCETRHISDSWTPYKGPRWSGSY